VALPASFRSLRITNYRRYFSGQVVSLCGTWAQNIGLGWLVIDLSDSSGVAVGIVTAMQFVPVLLFGLWMGVLADRFDKRRFIVSTQVVLAVLAGLLAFVDLAGVVNLPMVYGLAFLFGVATAADTPARLAFVVEMVGAEDLPNALALNSAVVNAGRIIGPAIAGAVIAAGGTGLCFLVNALSYVGTIIAVTSMRRSELQQPAPVARARGQVRDGLRYTWDTPLLRANMALMALVSLVAFNFPVVLPLLAKITFHGDATTYSLMASAMGVGAFVSALFLAAMARPYGRRLVWSFLTLGLAMCVGALSPTVVVLVAILTVVGAGQVIASSSANAMVQLDAEPAMRGRVTAIFSLTSQGVTPFGGVLAGGLAQLAGPRWAFGLGGVATLVALGFYGAALFRDHAGARHRAPAPEVEVEARSAPGPAPGVVVGAEAGLDGRPPA
jgi:MFS family permease